MHIRRRDFIRGMGLGAGATLLTPLLGRLISEARGEAPTRLNLMVLTDGNGWTHQAGGSRNSPTLNTTVRSPTDWDLPTTLASFESFKDKVTICRPFRNGHGINLHGNGWATLSAIRPIGSRPGGISLDRLVAKAHGLNDAFPSIALGVPKRPDRPPACTSADGPLRPFPAIGNPLDAHQTLFGGGEGVDAQQALAQEQSVLDLMIQDINRARSNLASSERAKLEQLLTSYRDMEQRLAKRAEIFANQQPPKAPSGDFDPGLNGQTIEAHVDIIAHAMAFGLTHVAHLSIMGFDAHNPGWGFLGFGGDAHENLAHVGSGYSKERSEEAYRTVIDYKAQQVAKLYTRLQEIQVGDGTMADRSLFVWINSGGGKHHDGYDWHPVVTIGDAGGKMRAGQYIEYDRKQHKINDAFLTIAQIMGVETDVFGDPNDNKEPLTELL